jgi:hypothetical protein
LDRYGIVAFSFGYRKDDTSRVIPGLSNSALAEEVQRVFGWADAFAEKNKQPSPVVVVQHEIYDCLPLEVRTLAMPIREHRIEGKYLDSEEVMAQAAFLLHKEGVKKVFMVAQPFLHRRKCVGLAKYWKFEPIVPDTKKIPFDKLSEQWWTRGPIRLVAYAILQKLFGRRGK